VTCCEDVYVEGAANLFNALSECACAPGVCDSECAGACPNLEQAGQELLITASCNACLQSVEAASGACNGAVSTACTPDPDCVAYVNCNNACP
jgi:hypothetical protein